MFANVEINGSRTRALADSGGGCFIIDASTVKLLGLPVIEWPRGATSLFITTVTTPKSQMGKYFTRFELKIGERVFDHAAYIMDSHLSKSGLILEKPFIKKHDLWINGEEIRFSPPIVSINPVVVDSLYSDFVEVCANILRDKSFSTVKLHKIKIYQKNSLKRPPLSRVDEEIFINDLRDQFQLLSQQVDEQFFSCRTVLVPASIEWQKCRTNSLCSDSLDTVQSEFSRLDVTAAISDQSSMQSHEWNRTRIRTKEV